MVQVQVRLPEQAIVRLDTWINQGRFRRRSDAVKTIVGLFEEKERTREFLKMLTKRSAEAHENPESLVPLAEL